MKDYCTGFPEFWYDWYGNSVYIGWICAKHDERCGSHGFYKTLWKHRIVGAVLIATVASVACWVRCPRLMLGKLIGREL